MPIVDLYSSRRAKDQETNDVWHYDVIPDKLRVQVAHIVTGAMGPPDSNVKGYGSRALYNFIRDSVAHEHGRDALAGKKDSETDLLECVRHEAHILIWLDVIELTFRMVEQERGRLNKDGRGYARITIPSDEAIRELNERFRRAGFGYRYEDGAILRVDDEFLHQEATRPALVLLSDPRFAGASDEFRSAHDHLKAGENKDCCVDALNAFESTMKAICDAKGWAFDKGARATDLLKILRREKLFPDFADQSFDQLLATLKGLSALRNETGAHGQGAVPVELPTYVAVYALNLAASKIRFLVEAFKESEHGTETKPPT
jgi:hypothetical protein